VPAPAPAPAPAAATDGELLHGGDELSEGEDEGDGVVEGEEEYVGGGAAESDVRVGGEDEDVEEEEEDGDGDGDGGDCGGGEAERTRGSDAGGACGEEGDDPTSDNVMGSLEQDPAIVAHMGAPTAAAAAAAAAAATAAAASLPASRGRGPAAAASAAPLDAAAGAAITTNALALAADAMAAASAATSAVGPHPTTTTTTTTLPGGARVTVVRPGARSVGVGPTTTDLATLRGGPSRAPRRAVGAVAGPDQLRELAYRVHALLLALPSTDLRGLIWREAVNTPASLLATRRAYHVQLSKTLAATPEDDAPGGGAGVGGMVLAGVLPLAYMPEAVAGMDEDVDRAVAELGWPGQLWQRDDDAGRAPPRGSTRTAAPEFLGNNTFRHADGSTGAATGPGGKVPKHLAMTVAHRHKHAEAPARSQRRLALYYRDPTTGHKLLPLDSVQEAYFPPLHRRAAAPPAEVQHVYAAGGATPARAASAAAAAASAMARAAAAADAPAGLDDSRAVLLPYSPHSARSASGSGDGDGSPGELGAGGRGGGVAGAGGGDLPRLSLTAFLAAGDAGAASSGGVNVRVEEGASPTAGVPARGSGGSGGGGGGGGGGSGSGSNGDERRPSGTFWASPIAAPPTKKSGVSVSRMPLAAAAAAAAGAHAPLVARVSMAAVPGTDGDSGPVLLRGVTIFEDYFRKPSAEEEEATVEVPR